MIDEKDIALFFNDTYRVLSIMNQPCYQVGDSYASITQKEIAALLNCNIMKINEIIKKLNTAGYIEKVPNHRGRYKINDKAKKLIRKIER